MNQVKLGINMPEKIKYYKKKGFTCVKCNGKLIKHDGEPKISMRPKNLGVKKVSRDGKIISHIPNKIEYEEYEEYCEGDIDIVNGICCISLHEKYDEEGNEYNDNIFYVCSECKYFYRQCKDCSTEDDIILCQFNGFSGYFNSDYAILRTLDNKLIKFLIAFYKNILDKDIDQYINNGILTIELDSNGIEDKIKEYCSKYNISYYKDSLDHIIKEIYEKESNEKIIIYNISDQNLEYFDISNCCPTGPDGGDCHYWRCNNCHKEFILTDK